VLVIYEVEFLGGLGPGNRVFILETEIQWHVKMKQQAMKRGCAICWESQKMWFLAKPNLLVCLDEVAQPGHEKSLVGSLITFNPFWFYRCSKEQRLWLLNDAVHWVASGCVSARSWGGCDHNGNSQLLLRVMCQTPCEVLFINFLIWSLHSSIILFADEDTSTESRLNLYFICINRILRWYSYTKYSLLLWFQFIRLYPGF
jgi:hypothetical protein